MSSKFCLRKRGFWKKFLQKRYVKIKTLFYSSGSKNVTKKCRMDQEKLFFFGMDVFSQNLHTLKS